MNSGGSSQSNQPEAIKAVRVQTSTYGAVIPLVWGQTRITGNIIWYGDFKANPVKSQSGGK